MLNQTVDSIYNVLINNIYNKNLVEGLMAVGASRRREA